MDTRCIVIRVNNIALWLLYDDSHLIFDNYRWLTKISQNPSRISKLVKRFLVLDNYVLRCYKTEPTDDISRGHSKDFSETALTADTAISVDPGRSMTILTPTKKIIIKIQDEQDRIVRWYQELRRAVQQLNARKYRITAF